MSVTDLWQRATAPFVCSVDCSECRDVYLVNKCPKRNNCTDKEVYEFIKRVNILLMDADKNDMVLTDEEFIDVLMTASEEL